MTSEKMLEIRECTFLKVFDTHFQISLQKALPLSSPTGSGCTAGGGVEERGGQRGNRGGVYTGLRGHVKGFHFHPEQDGQPRRLISNHPIYLSVKGIKSQSRKTRKETSTLAERGPSLLHRDDG